MAKEEEADEIEALRARAHMLPKAAFERRDAVLDQINRLARFVEDADGVGEIMRKWVTNRSGKVLVFCKDREHLYELSESGKVHEWFGLVNPINIHVYRCEAARADNNEQLEAFNKDDSSALKVLYSINMFNETIHVCRMSFCRNVAADGIPQHLCAANGPRDGIGSKWRARSLY